MNMAENQQDEDVVDMDKESDDIEDDATEVPPTDDNEDSDIDDDCDDEPASSLEDKE
jgi:hypothetical protein